MTVSHGPWEAVAEVGQAYEAELIALRLRDAGLEAEVLDQSYRQEPVPSVRAFSVVKVLVPPGHLEEARRLLAQGQALPEDVDSDDTPEEDTKVSQG